MTDPAAYLRDKRLLLDYQSGRLARGLERSVAGRRERLARLAAGLDAMSPLKVLGRGYSIALNGEGRALRGASELAAGDKIRLLLARGEAECTVDSVKGDTDGTEKAAEL